MRSVGLAITAAIALSAASAQAAAPNAKAVLATYADIARSEFEDSLAAARTLRATVKALLAAPSAETLGRARDAWRAARVPYMHTEAFRFGNKVVDDWEGRVNAWPLDEGLIDYVAPSYGTSSDANPLYAANVIANPRLRLAGKTIDARKITKKLLADTLHEAGKVEANVATGYHAVEFLLWGQDLNGTGPGAGNRPASDFDLRACTGGNCDRRRAYLEVATDLLVDDLKEMAAAWGDKGKARLALQKRGDRGGLSAVLTGLGSLSYGELAGERMKLGLMLHDPEEEHDCFSDNTHNSHFYNQAGMVAIYAGTYRRSDGSEVRGPGIGALVAAKDAALGARVEAALAETTEALRKVKDAADSGRMAYDQMIGEGNAEGNALVQAAIDALVKQTRAIEAAVAALGLKIKVEGSDSLDAPSKVKK